MSVHVGCPCEKNEKIPAYISAGVLSFKIALFLKRNFNA
jgi:hypothetical protein